jgi:hypothetical protein
MMQTKTTIRGMKRPSRTDWKRVDAMKDSDIDFSDIPELGLDFFANAILWRPRAASDEREADPDVAVPSKKVISDVLKVKAPEKSAKKLA